VEVAAAEAGPAAAAAAGNKSESKRNLPEKARRELAKELRATTGQSARVCEKALQMHADDMDRAANWLLDQVEKGEEAA